MHIALIKLQFDYKLDKSTWEVVGDFKLFCKPTRVVEDSRLEPPQLTDVETIFGCNCFVANRSYV